MRTVEQEQVASELALPPSVQEVLGELVNAARDGLLALSVGAGTYYVKVTSFSSSSTIGEYSLKLTTP